MTEPVDPNPRPSTRVAALTPIGAAGIAVIRLVGPDAADIARSVFRPLSRSESRQSLAPGRIHYGQIIDGEDVIDDVVLTARSSACLHPDTARADASPDPTPSAASDLVEINPHGGVRVVQRIVMLLVDHGATLVDRDEIGLLGWPCRTTVEREAWEAICQAQTHRAALWLAYQQTALPEAIRRCSDRLVTDDPAAAREVASDLDRLLERYEPARRLVCGAGVVILGPPNAGKSTLANRLFGRPRSIVAEQPGTTRDWVAEPTAVEGIPVTLIDTAGLRETLDAIERASIQRGLKRLASADGVLLVVDRSQPLDAQDRRMLYDVVRAHAAGRVLLVHNKCDLPAAIDEQDLTELPAAGSVTISATTGEGIDILSHAVAEVLGLTALSQAMPAPWTPRQQAALESARKLLADKPKKASEILSDLVEMC